MARPLRIEYPGACYHIMNRGNRKQQVFESQEDNELFLRKLQEFATAFSVDIYSYCLMGNHFHLYICTKEPNLSRFMQSLLTSFTITKNRRDNSSGHLFQGRFKSVLVENELYGSKLSRYIHLNPVRTEQSLSLGINIRQCLLHDFKWSSYTSICGLSKCPEWLKRNEVLKRWGKTIVDQQLNYAEYVEKGLLHEIDNPMSTMPINSVLGSDNFIEKMRKYLTDVTDNLNIRRELGEYCQMSSSYDFNTVSDAVSQSYKMSLEKLLKKNTRNNDARQVLIYLASRYCRGKYSLTQLAEFFNLTVGGFCRNRYIIKDKMQKNNEFSRIIESIEKSLKK